MAFSFRADGLRAETLDATRPGLVTVGIHIGDLRPGHEPLQPHALGRLARMALGYDR